MPMKKKVLPAVSVNRYYCYQATSLEPPLMVSHEGIQEWKQDAYHQAVSDCSHPQWCTLKGLWMRKPRILAPESWCAYERKDFSEPKLLHLPIHRKVLNSLTWDIWFSLVNSNFLMHWLPGLCCKIPINLGSSCAVLCLATSVMSDSLWPHGLQPTSLLCPRDSPGQSIGEGGFSLTSMEKFFRAEILSSELKSSVLSTK